MNITLRLSEAHQGIESIVVSDKDGVEIASAPADALSSGEARQSSQILSTIFTLTHEQCDKLPEFKKTNFLMSEFGTSGVLVQANYAPIVITVKADRRKVSDGQLLESVDQVKALFSGIRPQLAAVTTA